MRDLEKVVPETASQNVVPHVTPIASAAPSTATGVVKLGMEVMKHLSKLSRQAVEDLKASRGLKPCVTNEPENKLIAQSKDVRGLLIDVMKVIKLDEGSKAFLPAIQGQLRDEIASLFQKQGYRAPDDLVDAMVDALARRELIKYQERMGAVRKYVAMRLNEVLRRQWVMMVGDVTPPNSWYIKAKDSESSDTDESPDIAPGRVD